MSTGKDFMTMTQYANLGPSDQKQDLPQPPLEQPVPEGAELVDLPEAPGFSPGAVDFNTLIQQRASLRKYHKTAGFSLEELSFLLWNTQGIKQTVKTTRTYRTVPSAGARHAFETVILVNNVDGLEPGLYRYVASQHKLLPLPTPENIAEKLAAVCLDQKMLITSALTFIWVADVYRMAWRYGERGYRYLHLDAGHICQNLYLASEAINGGTCAIAAFDDNDTNALLDLDGESQFVVYLATVGKKR